MSHRATVEITSNECSSNLWWWPLDLQLINDNAFLVHRNDLCFDLRSNEIFLFLNFQFGNIDLFLSLNQVLDELIKLINLLLDLRLNHVALSSTLGWCTFRSAAPLIILALALPFVAFLNFHLVDELADLVSKEVELARDTHTCKCIYALHPEGSFAVQQILRIPLGETEFILFLFFKLQMRLVLLSLCRFVQSSSIYFIQL